MKTQSLVLLAALAIGVNATAQTASSHKPIIQLDAMAKRTLFERAVTLKAGDPMSTVLSQLGKPTYDQRRVAKESPRLICHQLTYYAVKWYSGVNELLDELVDVCLDEKDQVKSVYIRGNLAN